MKAETIHAWGVISIDAYPSFPSGAQPIEWTRVSLTGYLSGRGQSLALRSMTGPIREVPAIVAHKATGGRHEFRGCIVTALDVGAGTVEFMARPGTTHAD